MIADSGAPQKKQIHISGTELFYSFILEVLMMREARKETRKLEKLKGVEYISLTMSGSYRHEYPDLLGTKRERALMDLLEEMEKKVLAR
ncbi:hypothetical protein E2P81_ATG01341 [Venturia nashicola]|uniref:Uncharacterized protein n=1 Tax=Venturia nashicola TaxID=86259 RepID=A0A4Z1PV50_9PEZI|nr:hypothetical protein E6O75_ATG01372 [Venturia nashicola]TLD38798.1 hypothetical protein E2P81_ATG01341 [Venturia nashicola]